MKKILIALGLMLTAYAGADAQNNCKKMAVTRHIRTNRNVTKQKTVAQSCRLLPYQVCSINSDRRSVSCYKTMDAEGNNLISEQATLYGSTGKQPGEVDKPKVKTVIIKGESRGDYCKRDEVNKETVCFHDGGRLYRDDEGFYHYR